jgi:hypothetical protein
MPSFRVHLKTFFVAAHFRLRSGIRNCALAYESTDKSLVLLLSEVLLFLLVACLLGQTFVLRVVSEWFVTSLAVDAGKIGTSCNC